MDFIVAVRKQHLGYSEENYLCSQKYHSKNCQNSIRVVSAVISSMANQKFIFKNILLNLKLFCPCHCQFRNVETSPENCFPRK
mmetsp:Transcript_30997/g.41368  ORF Transcript_30997/g.41368 Transcript_30997/m.41368 type:complete len:83 (+) Transcript_30997:162-410(+)